MPRADSRRRTSPRTSGGKGGAWRATADDAAGRPRTLEPRADRRGCVLPQTSEAEGRGNRGPLSRDGRGGMSLRRPRDCCGDQRPARTAVRVYRHGRAARRGGEGEWRPTAVNTTAGRPQISAPNADGHRGASLRTNIREGAARLVVANKAAEIGASCGQPRGEARRGTTEEMSAFNGWLREDVAADERLRGGSAAGLK